MNQCLSVPQFLNFLNVADLWNFVEIVSAIHIKIHATAGVVDWFVFGSAVCHGGVAA